MNCVAVHLYTLCTIQALLRHAMGDEKYSDWCGGYCALTVHWILVKEDGISEYHDVCDVQRNSTTMNPGRGNIQ